MIDLFTLGMFYGMMLCGLCVPIGVLIGEHWNLHKKNRGGRA